MTTNNTIDFTKERRRVIKGLTLTTKSANWSALDEFLSFEQDRIKDTIMRTRDMETILELQGMYAMLVKLRDLPKTVDAVNNK